MPEVDDLRRKFWKKLMVRDIPFIRVPPKCIVIFKRSTSGNV